ncbi:MAG: oligosaccharide flippase family protein, partial [Zoogloeaceae bacterium]|nr:oligosaccharide flippase family protein [Zoogloeaceae bacterium]
MLRNLFWMVFSSAVRLGSGLVLFVLIARHLGPEEFGHYMFWYGLTLLFATLAGFGLGNMLLKEIAQHPETAAHTLGEALSLRLTLAVAVLCVALIAAFFVDRPELLLLLLFANLVEIIAETFYVAYRAIGHYRGEAHVATAAAFLQLLLVVIAVLAYQKTGFIALVFLAGKVLQLVLILAAARHVFGKFRLASPRTGLRLAQRTKAYAADMLMGSAFGNIDS